MCSCCTGSVCRTGSCVSGRECRSWGKGGEERAEVVSLLVSTAEGIERYCKRVIGKVRYAGGPTGQVGSRFEMMEPEKTRVETQRSEWSRCVECGGGKGESLLELEMILDARRLEINPSSSKHRGLDWNWLGRLVLTPLAVSAVSQAPSPIFPPRCSCCTLADCTRLTAWTASRALETHARELFRARWEQTAFCAFVKRMAGNLWAYRI